MKLRRLSTRDPGFEAEFGRLVAVDSAIDKGIERAAEAIVDDVRARGDAAVLEYTNRFDRMAVASVADLEISQAEMSEAFEGLPADQRDALRAAAEILEASGEGDGPTIRIAMTTGDVEEIDAGSDER